MFNSIYSSSSSFDSDLGVPSHYEIQNGASPRCFNGFLDDSYDSEDGSWSTSLACALDPTPTNEKATFDLRGAWGLAKDVKIPPKAPSKASPSYSDSSEDTISDYFSRLLVSSSSSFSSDDDSFDEAPLSDPYEDLDDDIFDPRTLYESSPNSPNQETLEHAGTTYTIHGVLGSGSFGEVVYALASTGDEVAIKICPKASPGILPSVLYDIVMNERDILVKTASGDYPFLTQPLACFQDADNVYFVMRLYSLNLAQLVFPIEASLQPQQIKLFAAELLLGLTSLHKLGVVHRDLKPDNILITPNGHLAIADFGLSKQFFAGRIRPEMKMFERWGTDGYLAPEVLAETCFTEGYTGAVDIWGYGIMLYEMLLGRRSVTANTPEGQIFMNTQLADVIHGDIDRRVDDEVVADLLHTILQANPSQRPSWKTIRNHEYFADVDWEVVKMRDSQVDATTVSLALDLGTLKPYCSRTMTGLKFKVQDYICVLVGVRSFGF
ncbi:hypothetical protein HWV62_26518 [Athelia sp. TMB]|nr:hypothetical protein HWV62_26518 [Athelia sp. TMB]